MALKPDDLAEAIKQQLTIYGEDVLKKVDHLTMQAASDLVKKTKATAPVGARKKFKAAIASKKVEGGPLMACKYAWYVKTPEYRLTHLLVHGHATRNGGRTKADPFLANALAEVLPAYEKNIEEAVKG